MNNKYTKIPCTLHWVIHNVDLKQKQKGNFEIEWARGNHKGQTDRLECDNEFKVNYEANFEIPCTMFVHKDDQSIRNKQLKITLKRFVENKLPKVYGKLTLDLGKYYSRQLEMQAANNGQQPKPIREDIEMETGRSIAPVLNCTFNIEQVGKIEIGDVDQNDISYAGGTADKMKVNIDDWDVTENDFANNEENSKHGKHSHGKKKDKSKKKSKKNKDKDSGDKNENENEEKEDKYLSSSNEKIQAVADATQVKEDSNAKEKTASVENEENVSIEKKEGETDKSKDKKSDSKKEGETDKSKDKKSDSKKEGENETDAEKDQKADSKKKDKKKKKSKKKNKDENEDEKTKSENEDATVATEDDQEKTDAKSDEEKKSKKKKSRKSESSKKKSPKKSKSGEDENSNPDDAEAETTTASTEAEAVAAAAPTTVERNAEIEEQEKEKEEKEKKREEKREIKEEKEKDKEEKQLEKEEKEEKEITKQIEEEEAKEKQAQIEKEKQEKEEKEKQAQLEKEKQEQEQKEKQAQIEKEKKEQEEKEKQDKEAAAQETKEKESKEEEEEEEEEEKEKPKKTKKSKKSRKQTKESDSNINLSTNSYSNSASASSVSPVAPVEAATPQQEIEYITNKSWSISNVDRYINESDQFLFPACVFPFYATLLHTRSLFDYSNESEKQNLSANNKRLELIDYFIECYDDAPLCERCTPQQSMLTALLLVLLSEQHKGVELIEPSSKKKKMVLIDNSKYFTMKMGAFVEKSVDNFLAPILQKFEVMINRFVTAKFEMDPLLNDFKHVFRTMENQLSFSKGINKMLMTLLLAKLEHRIIIKLISNPMRFMFNNAIVWNSFMSALLSDERIELNTLREVVFVLVMANGIADDPSLKNDIAPHIEPKVVLYIMKNYHPDIMLPQPIRVDSFVTHFFSCTKEEAFKEIETEKVPDVPCTVTLKNYKEDIKDGLDLDSWNKISNDSNIQAYKWLKDFRK